MTDMEEPIASTMTMDDIIADAIWDDADDEDNLNVAGALPTLPATDCPAPSAPTADIPTAQQVVLYKVTTSTETGTPHRLFQLPQQ